jgi:LysR family hydrogen peroxide-inducible transcriptional activator
MQPASNDLLTYVPFQEPVPDRRVVLAWRKSFTRIAAIEAVAQAVSQCDLPGVKPLPPAPLLH